ncbi:Uncharacterized membrane protein YcaP, DUF421 family [Fictibacillus enclensis]|nr:Uncharacterized membrane protein YcaP, DUF421 family [Fictibacillus enclensis]
MKDVHFFYGQDSLSIFQWIIRAVFSFFFLLLSTKIMGQRSISQLRLLDFIMAISIGNIIAHPLSDQHLSMKGAMVTISALVFLYLILIVLSLKWSPFTKFIDPPPFTLIKDGAIYYKGLRKARIPLDILLSELRKKQIEDPQKVALALWEPDGTISFFLKAEYNALTPKDLNINIPSFKHPITLIKDGQVDMNHLNKIGKDEDWLKKQIKTEYSVELSQILLATIDTNNQLTVFLYY